MWMERLARVNPLSMLMSPTQGESLAGTVWHRCVCVSTTTAAYHCVTFKLACLLTFVHGLSLTCCAVHDVQVQWHVARPGR